MKTLMMILLVVFVPGGIFFAIGKWLKHIRETHYPDIECDYEDCQRLDGHA